MRRGSSCKRALGTRAEVEAFCLVAPGSGMIDLAGMPHDKPKRELATQFPHLWSDMRHAEMDVDMRPSLT